jgi:hypothetical protein
VIEYNPVLSVAALVGSKHVRFNDRQQQLLQIFDLQSAALAVFGAEFINAFSDLLLAQQAAGMGAGKLRPAAKPGRDIRLRRRRESRYLMGK